MQRDEYHISLNSHKNKEEKIQEIKTLLELHQRRTDAMQTNLKIKIQRSKEDGDLLDVISFDLQQALPIPQFTVGKVFYLRKAWMYNLR